MKKFTTMIILSAMIAVTVTMTAKASSYTDGDILSDICDWLCSSSVSGNFNTQLPNTVGTATYTWLGRSLPGEAPAWADVQTTQFSGSGFDPVLGNYTFSLDPRRLLNSRLQANGVSGDVPFTSTIRFHVTLTLANQPNFKYSSIDQIELQNTNVQAWPYSHAIHTQNGSSRFERTDKPGIPAFTLSNISADVTEHANG